jgi:hypothetical protein
MIANMLVVGGHVLLSNPVEPLTNQQPAQDLRLCLQSAQLDNQMLATLVNLLLKVFVSF